MSQRSQRAQRPAAAYVPYTEVVDLTVSDPEPRRRNGPSVTASRSSQPSQSSYYPRAADASPHPSAAAAASDSFGSSILRPSKSSRAPSRPGSAASSSKGFSSFIKPATVGGFASQSRPSQAFDLSDTPAYQNGWPTWALQPAVMPVPPRAVAPPPAAGAGLPRSRDEVEEHGEEFDLAQAKLTAADYERHHGDPEAQMRELLAGAVGEGEDEGEDDDEHVEGFAANMRLMPHQVRGVRWMREREKGRKYGGILADVGSPAGAAGTDALTRRTWVLARPCRPSRASSRASRRPPSARSTRAARCECARGGFP